MIPSTTHGMSIASGMKLAWVCANASCLSWNPMCYFMFLSRAFPNPQAQLIHIRSQQCLCSFKEQVVFTRRHTHMGSRWFWKLETQPSRYRSCLSEGLRRASHAREMVHDDPCLLWHTGYYVKDRVYRNVTFVTHAAAI